MTPGGRPVVASGGHLVYNPRVPKLEFPERFARTVGRRVTPEPGHPPSAETRAAMSRMAHYRTAVPKGVFIYESHEEANADWDRWREAAMRLRRSTRARHD